MKINSDQYAVISDSIDIDWSIDCCHSLVEGSLTNTKTMSINLRSKPAIDSHRLYYLGHLKVRKEMS